MENSVHALIIEDFVPEGDEKWELFLQLMTIIMCLHQRY